MGAAKLVFSEFWDEVLNIKDPTIYAYQFEAINKLHQN